MNRQETRASKQRDRSDVWNARLLRGCRFEGKYEMPALSACNIMPHSLIKFSDATIKRADASFIHFYENDYKFERIWRNPERYLRGMKSYGGVIAPDFSVYREMPLCQQLYNVYRNRAIGYWLTRNGISVIPNARWGDARTYEFCFDGLPQNSVIAVGTHGCVKHKDDRKYFTDGFLVMLECVKPTKVLVYGSASDKYIPPLLACNIEIVQFDSDFARSRNPEVA